MSVILRYKGYWVKTNRDKLKELKFSEKVKAFKEYFSEETAYIIERIKNYWIGYVDIHVKDILCGDEKPYRKEIYAVSIIVGRHGNGQWFSEVGRDTIEKLVNEWEHSDKKWYEFYLDWGGCVGQRYTFSRRQKDMLISQLKPLLDMKWYEEN